MNHHVLRSDIAARPALAGSPDIGGEVEATIADLDRADGAIGCVAEIGGKVKKSRFPIPACADTFPPCARAQLMMPFVYATESVPPAQAAVGIPVVSASAWSPTAMAPVMNPLECATASVPKPIAKLPKVLSQPPPMLMPLSPTHHAWAVPTPPPATPPPTLLPTPTPPHPAVSRPQVFSLRQS